METLKLTKQQLLRGNMVELTDDNENLFELFRGHNDSFCLMMNAKVIKSTRTWDPVKAKMETFRGLHIISL